jgi:hypothetical protein
MDQRVLLGRGVARAQQRGPFGGVGHAALGQCGLQLGHRVGDGAVDLVEDLVHSVLELEGQHQLLHLDLDHLAVLAQVQRAVMQLGHGAVHVGHHGAPAGALVDACGQAAAGALSWAGLCGRPAPAGGVGHPLQQRGVEFLAAGGFQG